MSEPINITPEQSWRLRSIELAIQNGAGDIIEEAQLIYDFLMGISGANPA